MLCHFHSRRVVKAMRYIISPKTMHDQWKQTPYQIWFLRRCDIKSSSGNEVVVSLRFSLNNCSDFATGVHFIKDLTPFVIFLVNFF